MEVVVTGSDTASATSFISVTDVQTGSHVHTFKQSASSKQAVTSIGSALFVAQNDKAIINVYRWHKEAIDQKIIVPERLDVITASHDGTWLLGGSATGKLYLWEVASGNLVFVKDAHYQAITSCQFSEDDLTFVTGSADATIQVWRTSDIHDTYTQQELVKPAMQLTHHSLAITDVHLGCGTSVSARLYTASLDQTIRIWDLITGEPLTTLLLPSPVTCMAVDPAERVLFAGTVSGTIYEVRLYKKEKVIRAIGGMGAIVSVGGEDEGVLNGHESAISSLILSLDGSLLTSGAQDGNAFVWEVATKQMTRKLKQQPSAVTLLYTAVRPHQEAVVQKSQATQFQPFKRVQTERDRDEHTLHLKLSTHSRAGKFQPLGDVEAAKIGLAHFVTGTTTTTTSDPVAQETIAKLREEVRGLHASLGELRVKHEQLNRDYISSQI